MYFETSAEEMYNGIFKWFKCRKYLKTRSPEKPFRNLQ